MNPLEKLHKEIDESGWDGNNNNYNKVFQEANDQIEKVNDEILLRKSEVERWVFAFNKNADTGISYHLAGTKTLENGDEVAFEWPDKSELKEADYTHIFERFNQCVNLHAKTEYGLLLYYSGVLKNNSDVILLLNSLFELSKFYYERVRITEDLNSYSTLFKLTIEHGIKISSFRKRVKEIKAFLDNFIDFSSQVHRTWDITNIKTIHLLSSLTLLEIQYKKDFIERVDFNQFLKQNFIAANEIAKHNQWRCIQLCDISQRLADSLNSKDYDWKSLKASQYVKMIEEAVQSGNMAAVSYAEKALEIYKNTGNIDKINELEKKYDELRRKFNFGEFKQELPAEETQRIFDVINAEINNRTEEELVIVLLNTPMFSSIEEIKERSQKISKETLLINIIPSSIIDKFGNTVATYTTEEEKEQFNFWQSYNYDFQIGNQTLITFFIKGISVKKIYYEKLESFLKKTWIAKEYEILYNGQPRTICPYDVIKPGLTLYFEELTKWNEDNEYVPNFICATDSLVTKTEYLLRFFCNLAGIATFTTKQKGHSKYKMEKNIDELLSSLRHTNENPTGFSEQHRLFIQFILSHKLGRNLRHNVAHGLLDANEYDFSNPLYIIIIILKISAYSFIDTKNETYK